MEKISWTDSARSEEVLHREKGEGDEYLTDNEKKEG